MFERLRKFFVNGGSHATLTATDTRKLPKGFFVNSIPIDAAGEDGFQKIIPVGYFPNHPGGAHEITAENIRQMFDNFMRSAKPAILVDYEHRSLWGDSRAAGWSSALEVRADGLYFKRPDWTPAASEMIENGEYKFFSPVYQLAALDLKGKQIGAKFVSAAVTNIPVYEEEIDPILNSQLSTEGEFDMKLTPEQRAQVIKNHGLAETATDEEIEKVLLNSKKVDEAPDDPPADTPAADPPASSVANSAAGKGLADLTVIVNGLVETVKTLASSAAARSEKDDAAMVDGWIRDFRMLPADRQAVLNSLKADRAGTIEIYSKRAIGSFRPSRISTVERANSGAAGDPAKPQSWSEKVDAFRAKVNSTHVAAGMVN